MMWVGRGVAAIASVMLGRYAVSYGSSVVAYGGIGLLPLALIALTWSVLSLCFAAAGHRPEVRRHLGAALMGGLAVGSVAFAAGFIGPMIIAPSNQGPLLGIVVTGPLGFVLGAIAGAARSLTRTSPRPVAEGARKHFGRAVRSVGAILAGWLVASFIGALVEFIMVSALGGGDPTVYFAVRNRPGIAVVVLTCRAALGFLGGIVAARIAGYAPLLHGVALAFVQTLPALWLLGQAADSARYPSWLTIATALLVASASVAGGFVQGRGISSHRVQPA